MRSVSRLLAARTPAGSRVLAAPASRTLSNSLISMNTSSTPSSSSLSSRSVHQRAWMLGMMDPPRTGDVGEQSLHATISTPETLIHLSAGDIIRTRHRESEKLYEDYKHAIGTEAKLQKAQALIHALGIHATAEEAVIYPMIKNMPLSTRPEFLFDRSQSEHQEQKDQLLLLAKTSVDDPTYSTKLEELMKDLEKHIKEEETEVLPALQQYYSSEQWQNAGKDYLNAEKMVAINPHPLAPNGNHPFLAMMTNLLTKPMDLLRNRITGGPSAP